MRIHTHRAFFLLALLAPAAQATDWMQPPVGCIESFVARPDEIACLDLSRVANPLADLPSGLTPEEVQFWTVDHRPDLTLCRAKEVMRREAANPGSQTATQVYVGYMRSLGGERLPEKIRAIYEASALVGMPPQILFGALFQESVLAELMIEVDGGNYSCGIAQLNVQEWCHGMKALPESRQAELGWPSVARCSDLNPDLIAPLHDIAWARGKLESLPEYRLQRRHYEGIRFEEVKDRIPGDTLAAKELRFQAARSFVQNCSDATLGIFAKARELRRLFNALVPEGMKTAFRYSGGATFNRSCQSPYASEYSPLHPGWLLADATYNAGGRQVDLVAHYFGIPAQEPASSKAWSSLSPLDLIEALHWGGKFNPTSGKLEFRMRSGAAATQSWFKSCVVQRHIARVIQYVTPYGLTIARSLEQSGCTKDSVPEYRQRSSGTRGQSLEETP